MNTMCEVGMWRALGWILLIGAAAQAGAICDDGDTPLPAAPAAESEYACVGLTDFGASRSGGLAFGALIAEGRAVAAAGAADERPCIGMTVTLKGTVQQVAEAFALPGWEEDSSLGSDIELIRLEEAVQGVTPALPYSGTDGIDTFARYGGTGTGLIEPTSSANTRRAGRNLTSGLGTSTHYADAIRPRDLRVPSPNGIGTAARHISEYLPGAGNSGMWSADIDPVMYRAGLTFFRSAGGGHAGADHSDRAGATRDAEPAGYVDTYPKVPRPTSAVLFAAILTSLPWCTGRRTLALR